MKPLRTRLQEARRATGLPWEVLERDYLLSWILAGIGQVTALRDTLVFKGGTALKKCYFGEYRFSEDLDFTGSSGVPTGDALLKAIGDACAAASGLLDEYVPVDIDCVRYAERHPHPGGQEAFTIRARLPWQRESTTRVMVEVTMDEPVLRPTVRRPILHEYGDQMELAGFAALLSGKCDVRLVAFNGPDDFFAGPVLDHVERTWNQWLGPLVAELPPFESVVTGLRSRIGALLR